MVFVVILNTRYSCFKGGFVIKADCLIWINLLLVPMLCVGMRTSFLYRNTPQASFCPMPAMNRAARMNKTPKNLFILAA